MFRAVLQKSSHLRQGALQTQAHRLNTGVNGSRIVCRRHYLSSIRRFDFTECANLNDTDCQTGFIYWISSTSDRLNPSMPMNRPSRRPSPASRLVIFLLAFAVFGWGLHYKLSLYARSASSCSQAPHAKLLSQKERPAEHRSVVFDPPRSLQLISYVFPSLILLCFAGRRLCLNSIFRVQDVLADEQHFRLSLAASIYFSFRPPPALL
jgi:hypothetical protein